MYIDYENGGGLESVVGYRKILGNLGKPHSIFRLKTCQGDFIYIHYSSFLYRFNVEKRDNPDKTCIGRLCDSDSITVSRGSIAFIYDGEKIYGFDNDGMPYDVLGFSGEGIGAMEIYDGRLFVSVGCDIYYSTPISEGKISIPKENIISSPTLGADITSLFSASDRLWIFKSFDDGSGGIVCRRKDDDRYPIVKVISGIYSYRAPISCDGEIFFLSRGGLYSIDTLNDEKINLRSSLLAEFSKEEMKNCHLGLWKGYIAIASGEKICLADKRRVSFGEFERFPIEGIGGYKNARRVYRYASVNRDGFALSKTPDAVATGEVYSLTDESGETIYFEDGEEKTLLYPTDEMGGGEFFPAKCYLIEEDLMWFGSGEGGLYLFNSDKRGVCPEHLKSDDCWEDAFSDKIHPYYYSFDSHKPEYLIEFSSDDGGFTDIKKQSLAHSLLIGCKSFVGGGFRIRVRCDGRVVVDRQVDSSLFSFSDTSLGSFSAEEGELCVTLNERGLPYLRKKIEIFSDEYSSPFGIDLVGYRYKPVLGSSKI